MQSWMSPSHSMGTAGFSIERVAASLRIAVLGALLLLTAAYLPDASFCLVNELVGIGCPGCGGTRAVLALCHGNFVESLSWNPGMWLGGLAATCHLFMRRIVGRDWLGVRSGTVGITVFCAAGIARAIVAALGIGCDYVRCSF